jgi:hypothetical protein
LQKRKSIAIQRGVHLQSVTAMFDNVGIHETRNDPLSDQRFEQSLR